MRTMTIVTVALVLLVGVAGCAEKKAEATGPTAVEGCVGETCGEFELGDAEGAISGLIIDDRLRPLAQARVLLLPLGLDALTNDVGEFGFVGLNPGTYTLKVSKEKHEAAPKRIDVVGGQFSEAIIEARRTVSENSVIITQEYSVFVPCAVDAFYTGLIWGCGTDLSGDNSRFSFRVEYSDITDVSWLVAEAKISQVGDWTVQMRHDNGESAGGERYAVAEIRNLDYVKMALRHCEDGQSADDCPANTEWNGQNNNVQWLNDKNVATLLFMVGEFEKTVPCNPGGLPVCEAQRGLGVRLGTKARFVHSLFIGEPEVDINSYAVLG